MFLANSEHTFSYTLKSFIDFVSKIEKSESHGRGCKLALRDDIKHHFPNWLQIYKLQTQHKNTPVLFPCTIEIVLHIKGATITAHRGFVS